MSVSDLEKPKQENNKYLDHAHSLKFLAFLGADNPGTFNNFARANPAITLGYLEMFCVTSNFAGANHACSGCSCSLY